MLTRDVLVMLTRHKPVMTATYTTTQIHCGASGKNEYM